MAATPRPGFGRFLQHRFAEWIKRSGTSQAALARAIGVDRSQITDVVRHGRGAGDKTMIGFAKLLGLSYADLISEAEHWIDSNPEKAFPDPYPSRRAAADAARELGLDDAAIRFVLGLPDLYGDADPGAAHWLDFIRLETRRRRAEERAARASSGRPRGGLG